MSKDTYRDHFRPIIARVLRINAGQTQAKTNQALRDAFPMGQRAMHPYKIWLDEIRVQRGLKKDKRRKRGEPVPVKSSKGQGGLFDG